MRASVFGWYGMRNIGDDVFCHVLNWAIPHFWNVTSVKFAGPPLPGLPRDRFVLPEYLYNSNGMPSQIARYACKLTLLAGVDLIIYGGGSVFGGMTYFSEKRLHEIWSRFSRSKLVGVGVSVGPFLNRHMEKRVAEVLTKFSYLSVRDEASAERIRNLGVDIVPVVSADLAGLLPEALGDLVLDSDLVTERSGKGKLRLGVSLLGRDPSITEDMGRAREERVIQAVRKLCSSNPVELCVFVFNNHKELGDKEVSLRFAERMKADGTPVNLVTYELDLKPVWEALSKCDACLHMRLHGGILSYVAGKPFALIPYQEKNKDFLDDIGQSSTLRLDKDGGSAEEILRVLNTLFDNPTMPIVTREQFAQKSRLNFTAAPWFHGQENHDGIM